MNSGVMALAPSPAELARLERLLSSAEYNRIGHRTDPGDQSVWRHFYERVFELPVTYNVVGTTNLSGGDWDGAHIYHDVESYRKRFQPPPDSGMALALGRHSSQAAKLVTEVCERVGLEC